MTHCGLLMNKLGHESSRRLAVTIVPPAKIFKENLMRPMLVTVFFIALVGSPAFAQQLRERTISVRGTGKVLVVPDHLVLTIQVTVPMAESATEALSRNSKLTADAIAVLKRFNVAESDIQTTSVSLSPVYDYDKRVSPPPIIGYSAQNVLQFMIRKMSDAGRIMDELARVGGTMFGPLRYESAKRKELEREALKKAIDDAKAKTVLLAQQLGVSVGNIVSIREEALPEAPVRPMMVTEARSTADVPIMPGEIEITANVEIVFEIK